MGNDVVVVESKCSGTMKAEGFLKDLFTSLFSKNVVLQVRKLDVESMLKSLIKNIPTKILEITSTETMIAMAVAGSLSKQATNIDRGLIREGILAVRENYGVTLSEECLSFFTTEGLNAINRLNVPKGLEMSLDNEKFETMLKMMEQTSNKHPTNHARMPVDNNLQVTDPSLVSNSTKR